MSGVSLFTAAMEVCDPDLPGHSARVERYAVAIATRIGWDEERLAPLRLGASLHDVGKVSVRPEVLRKPSSLTPAELAEVRAHPVEGMWLLGGMRSLVDVFPYVLFHHERWDGEGYPTRRAADDIPLGGRILAVADAFDAMLSNRPYREAFEIDRALAEIRECAGSQFDPELAEAFLDAVAAGEIEPAATGVAALR